MLATQVRQGSHTLCSLRRILCGLSLAIAPAFRFDRMASARQVLRFSLSRFPRPPENQAQAAEEPRASKASGIGRDEKRAPTLQMVSPSNHRLRAPLTLRGRIRDPFARPPCARGRFTLGKQTATLQFNAAASNNAFDPDMLDALQDGGDASPDSVRGASARHSCLEAQAPAPSHRRGSFEASTVLKTAGLFTHLHRPLFPVRLR